MKEQLYRLPKELLVEKLIPDLALDAVTNRARASQLEQMMKTAEVVKHCIAPECEVVFLQHMKKMKKTFVASTHPEKRGSTVRAPVSDIYSDGDDWTYLGSHCSKCDRISCLNHSDLLVEPIPELEEHAIYWSRCRFCE